MTPNFDNLASALLEAEGKKKKPRKKKGHNYKFDSRSGKYYKPKTISEWTSRHEGDSLTWEQEEQLIGMLRRWKKPYPTASPDSDFAAAPFGP